ncbi:MAG: SDR family oxidoreductase [Dehalococcoidia bacterium]|nr:SDR family oxidoreductase [Dehalococcoidia bacterium]MDW8119199.1 SDR family oxidoreductase [Chloroflexota bacterium]
MDLGIAGRVAMVTGGSRGLGRECVWALAREGCKVAFCARGIEGIHQAQDEFRRAGLQTLGIQADVMTAEGCQQFYDKTLEAFGRVDILVHNAGGTRGGRDFDTATDQDWLDTLNLNLLAAVRLCRLVLPGMKERRWGRIVTIASIWGREYGGAPSYMVAKAALIAFTKHLATTLAPYGVLCNSVAPGSILFPGGSWDRFVKNSPPQVVQEFIARNLPMGKFGWPEPVGALVAFLCSERADLITGACYTVDGGQSRSLI